MHFSVYEHQQKDHRPDKISSAWDHDSVIQAKPSSKQLFKVEHDEQFNLSGDRHSDSLAGNRMCYVNVNVMFNEPKVMHRLQLIPRIVPQQPRTAHLFHHPRHQYKQPFKTIWPFQMVPKNHFRNRQADAPTNRSPRMKDRLAKPMKSMYPPFEMLYPQTINQHSF